MKQKKVLLKSLLLMMGFVLLFVNGCTKENDVTETDAYSIGQSYGGGIIFYIDNTKQHGLICAPFDQSASIQWSNGSNVITNASGVAIGTGNANTQTIIAVQGAGNYAAQICNNLSLNGYSDWYLPSKGECYLMYFNLKTMRQTGGFADSLYWSSTEASINNAYSQYSNDGYPPNGGYYKTSSYHVRAIRAF